MGYLFILFFLTVHSFAVLSPKVEIETVTLLPKSESETTHLVHGGILWVGRGKSALDDCNKVEAYDPNTNKLLGSFEIQHTANAAYPFGKNSVLVVGNNFDTIRSYYSIVEYKNTDGQPNFSLNSYALDEEVIANFFAGDPRQMFFTSEGENRIYRELPLPSGHLKPKIKNVWKMAWTGTKLFAIEHNDWTDDTDDNLVVIDPVAETFYRPLRPEGKKLTEILYSPLSETVSLSESYANLVHVFEASSGKIKKSIPFPEVEPRALANFGSCLVVAPAEALNLNFYNLDTFEKVAKWNLNDVGPNFERVSAITVDEKTGTVFLRANTPCSSCGDDTRNSVIAVREFPRVTSEACQVGKN